MQWDASASVASNSSGSQGIAAIIFFPRAQASESSRRGHIGSSSHCFPFLSGLLMDSTTFVLSMVPHF